MSTLNRATTVVSNVSRQCKEYGDVNRTEETVETITARIEVMNGDLQQEIDQLKERYDPLRKTL